jgi:hypothetical protein
MPLTFGLSGLERIQLIRKWTAGALVHLYWVSWYGSLSRDTAAWKWDKAVLVPDSENLVEVLSYRLEPK